MFRLTSYPPNILLGICTSYQIWSPEVVVSSPHWAQGLFGWCFYLQFVQSTEFNVFCLVSVFLCLLQFPKHAFYFHLLSPMSPLCLHHELWPPDGGQEPCTVRTETRSQCSLHTLTEQHHKLCWVRDWL